MTGWPTTACDVCGGSDLRPVLSLGSSPPTCFMREIGTPSRGEVHYPLELLRCEDCTLVQLSVKVDAEDVFPATDYPYASGNSRALHEDFEDLAAAADSLLEGLTRRDLVVDIGANDGTLLSKFQGCRTLGVEPTVQAAKIDGDYIPSVLH